MQNTFFLSSAIQNIQNHHAYQFWHVPIREIQCGCRRFQPQDRSKQKSKASWPNQRPLIDRVELADFLNFAPLPVASIEQPSRIRALKWRDGETVCRLLSSIENNPSTREGGAVVKSAGSATHSIARYFMSLAQFAESFSINLYLLCTIILGIDYIT